MMSLMRLRHLRHIAATLAVLVLSACGQPSAEPVAGTSPLSDDLPAAFQAVVDDALVASQAPGAAVIIDAGAGPWVSLTGSSNVAEGSPVESSDRFSYRGITTSFVVTAVLKLAADGRIGLDDPVSTWVPDVPGGEAVTLRHLAGMRSGLAPYTDSDAFHEVTADDPSRTHTDQQLLGYSFAQDVRFAPGERYEYSGTNAVLLGLVLEAVTGKPWSNAVAELVTGPLGLTSVSYPGPMRIPEPAASGYRIVDGEPVEAPTPVATLYSSAGGLSGNVTDLARWGQALGSGELLTPELQAARTDDASPVSDDPDSPGYDSYGLGLGEIEGWWGHAGHGMGFSSLVMSDPATGHTITILLNASPEDADLPAEMFRQFVGILDASAS